MKFTATVGRRKPLFLFLLVVDSQEHPLDNLAKLAGTSRRGLERILEGIQGGARERRRIGPQHRRSGHRKRSDEVRRLEGEGLEAVDGCYKGLIRRPSIGQSSGQGWMKPPTTLPL